MHFHISAMFVNIPPFYKEDRILIESLYLLKGNTVQKLLNQFPSRSWKEQSHQRLLKEWHTVENVISLVISC